MERRIFSWSWVVGGVVIVALGVWLILSAVSAMKAEGASDLKADAGPDQTVPGPSPAWVEFDGSGSSGDIVRYQWFNQWGLLRQEADAYDISGYFQVNFGNNNPPEGTTRTFTLVVHDSEGNTDKDSVTITLGPDPTEGSHDPRDGQGFTGIRAEYDVWGYGGPAQWITAGHLQDGRWYLASTGVGEDFYGLAATVECRFGEHWEVSGGDFIDREGCVGDVSEVSEFGDVEDLVVLVGGGGWIISDTGTYSSLAILTPRDDTPYEFKRTTTISDEGKGNATQ